MADKPLTGAEIEHRRSLEKLAAAATGAFKKTHSARATGPRAGHGIVKKKLIDAVGGRCEACSFKMPEPTMLHSHHVVLVKRGGTSTTDNGALLCPNCHAIAHWIDRKVDEELRPKDRVELLKALREFIRRSGRR